MFYIIGAVMLMLIVIVVVSIVWVHYIDKAIESHEWDFYNDYADSGWEDSIDDWEQEQYLKRWAEAQKKDRRTKHGSTTK